MIEWGLTDAERESPLWARLSAHLEERLESLRAQNDGDKDERETARLRGQIAEVKALLGLGVKRPEFKHPGPQFKNLGPRQL